MSWVQRRLNYTAVEPRALVSDYTPRLYVDVITYRHPYSAVGLANLC